MKNKIIALILTAVMALTALVGCSSAFNYAEEDLNSYVTFDAAAFKEALKKIEIEDADFTTSESVRAQKVVDSIVSSLADYATKNKNKTEEGEFSLTDVLYYAYYTTYTVTSGEGDDKTETTYVFDLGEMKVSDFDDSTTTVKNKHSISLGAIDVNDEDADALAVALKNAIAALSEVVCEIYKLQVPKKENTITTYNVGIIEGGTSVNTIAQKASMLCEYRSNDRECLAIMKAEFERIFAAANTAETKLTVNMIGNRPCKGEVDPVAEAELIDAYRQAVKAVTGKDIMLRMASTDANIPMSLGIPAIDVGSYIGAGAHRREEYVEKASLVPGLEIMIRTALILTK